MFPQLRLPHWMESCSTMLATGIGTFSSRASSLTSAMSFRASSCRNYGGSKFQRNTVLSNPSLWLSNTPLLPASIRASMSRPPQNRLPERGVRQAPLAGEFAAIYDQLGSGHVARFVGS